MKQATKIKIIATCLMLVARLVFPCMAEEGGAKKVFTRKEAVEMLTATDVVKKKVGELLSWTVGYDLSKVKRAGLTPSIKYLAALPLRVPPDGKTVLEILAQVDDPGGIGNIAGVQADLSSIGRLPNTVMLDAGLYGDQKANDGTYTLQTSVSPAVALGVKDIPVEVTNKTGWLAYAKTSLDVNKNPDIIEAGFFPEEVSAEGKTMLLLWSKVRNPGGLENAMEVTADLRTLSFTEVFALQNTGQEGDKIAGDDIFSLQLLLPDDTRSGEYRVKITAQNQLGGKAEKEVILKVRK